jgi:cytoplasmic iron level regulating protein YaaA (DUF328/UPF0246 family)
MLVLLSPAKSLDFETPAPVKKFSEPELLAHSAKLMTTVKKLSPAELCKLMSISEKLGQLNFERNQVWKKSHTLANSKQCLFAFQGDVYQGMKAETMSSTQVTFCNKHVRILSGLYGVLRPLDLMQPYRLEMGTRLATKSGARLYDFWDAEILNLLSAQLKKQKSKLIINLASNEYSTAAKLKQMDAKVVAPVFKDWKNGQYKLISFFAKKARGTMTRFIVDNKITNAKDLEGFDYDGYQFNASMSGELTPTFTRKA